MPSTSKKQKRFMQMCATPEGRAWARKNGVACPPLSVAKEYVEADKLEGKKPDTPKQAANRNKYQLVRLVSRLRSGR